MSSSGLKTAENIHKMLNFRNYFDSLHEILTVVSSLHKTSIHCNMLKISRVSALKEATIIPLAVKVMVTVL